MGLRVPDAGIEIPSGGLGVPNVGVKVPFGGILVRRLVKALSTGFKMEHRCVCGVSFLGKSSNWYTYYGVGKYLTKRSFSE